MSLGMPPYRYRIAQFAIHGETRLISLVNTPSKYSDLTLCHLRPVAQKTCDCLQPANILLDENGHVRISDLGLACDFSKKKPHASVWVKCCPVLSCVITCQCIIRELCLYPQTYLTALLCTMLRIVSYRAYLVAEVLEHLLVWLWLVLSQYIGTDTDTAVF